MAQRPAPSAQLRSHGTFQQRHAVFGITAAEPQAPPRPGLQALQPCRRRRAAGVHHRPLEARVADDAVLTRPALRHHGLEQRLGLAQTGLHTVDPDRALGPLEGGVDTGVPRRTIAAVRWHRCAVAVHHQLQRAAAERAEHGAFFRCGFGQQCQRLVGLRRQNHMVEAFTPSGVLHPGAVLFAVFRGVPCFYARPARPLCTPPAAARPAGARPRRRRLHTRAAHFAAPRRPRRSAPPLGGVGARVSGNADGNGGQRGQQQAVDESCRQAQRGYKCINSDATQLARSQRAPRLGLGLGPGLEAHCARAPLRSCGSTKRPRPAAQTQVAPAEAGSAVGSRERDGVVHQLRGHTELGIRAGRRRVVAGVKTRSCTFTHNGIALRSRPWTAIELATKPVAARCSNRVTRC